MPTTKSTDHGSGDSTKSQLKDAAVETAETAKTSARSALQDATQEAKTRADTAKSSVADEVSGVAASLRTAANEMRNGSPQERTFGQIAEGLADASEALRHKDLGTMVHDINSFARKNPLVFLGGAALIGFAATRFAKASSEPDTAVAEAGSPYPSTYGGMS